MWYKLAIFFLLLILVSCKTSGSTDQDLQRDNLDTAAVYQEAYNEHVELNVGGKATQVKIDGVSVNFVRRGNKVFFDLPNSPFPYTAPPSSNAAYTNRGSVNVEVTIANSSTPFIKSYQLYGAVASGEINLLLPLQGLEGGCPTTGFFMGYKIVNAIASSSGSPESRLCFLTLDIRTTQNNTITHRGTKQAISYLSGQMANELALDRNVLFSLDNHNGKPALSYDPSCDQLEQWVENENANKQRLDPAAILSQVNAGAAHSAGILGTGVRVAIIGGGIDLSFLSHPGQVIFSPNQNFVEPGLPPVEDFECDFDDDGNPDFLLHDTHAAQILSTIAPNATLIPHKICDDHGDCPSAKAVMALMYLENTYNGRIIVSLSAGGPLRSDALFRFLETDPNRPNESFFVVASTGNNGRNVTHYPSTLSPLSNPQGSSASENLQNVISVAAYGLATNGTEALALFNTRSNSDIFGPGINICVSSVTLQCQTASDPGIGGTSFAAPMVAGVAALYTQAQPTANPYTLLTGNAQPLTGTTLGKVWYQ